MSLAIGVFLLTPHEASALSPVKVPVSVNTGSNIVRVASSTCSNIAANLQKLKQHNDYSKSPPPDWVTRRVNLYQSQLKSAGCTTGSTASSSSCSTSEAKTLQTLLANLLKHNDYKNGVDWALRREARYESELAALGCSVSGSSSSSSASSSGSSSGSSNWDYADVPSGKLSWRSGMTCGSQTAEAAWRGSKMTSTVGWAPYRYDWNAIIKYFSGGSLNKFINAKKDGSFPSIGLPMLPETHRGQLKQCANGQFDNYFTKIAQILKDRGLADISLRLGWEANLRTYPWIADYGVANYKSCFRRIVHKMHSVAPKLKFNWHNGKRTHFDRNASDLYPGDDVVDFIGVSYYDRDTDNRTQAKWNESAQRGDMKNPIGIETWMKFAKSHGKKLALAEWGITNRGNTTFWKGNGDNALFIRNMYAFFKRNSGNIAYESYFNCRGGESEQVYMLYPTHYNPESSKMYKNLF
ncbi:MAG: hypothetical protein H6851_16765 [Geminicoccaceae bacterium]|nr:hypothetical protein [Geminicoccaceae bacterium]